MTIRRAYLANRMTGVPAFNYPWFIAEAQRLRDEHGIDVVSPAELDDPDVRAAALASTTGDMNELSALMNTSWGDFLARDVKIIADSNLDAVLVGPEWHLSRGARLETFVAHLSGIPVLWSDTLELVAYGDLVNAWAPYRIIIDKSILAPA